MDNITFFLLLFQAASAPLVSTNRIPSNLSPAFYYTAAAVQDKAVLEDESIAALYEAIGLKAYELNYDVFKYAMTGFLKLETAGKLNNDRILSIIDFTKASSEKRFYTIDLKSLKVRFHTLVSHGKNTGENMAKSFSNVMHSNQSSLGFYVTGETYFGSKGYSLRLDGMEKGYNDNMRDRAVVMHNADYVSESWVRKYGRLGRSQGCPALPQEIGKKVIDTVKGGTVIFAYYDDAVYLSTSNYLAQPSFIASTHKKQRVSF